MPAHDKSAGLRIWTHAVRPKGERHGWRESIRTPTLTRVTLTLRTVAYRAVPPREPYAHQIQWGRPGGPGGFGAGTRIRTADLLITNQYSDRSTTRPAADSV